MNIDIGLEVNAVSSSILHSSESPNFIFARKAYTWTHLGTPFRMLLLIS